MWLDDDSGKPVEAAERTGRPFGPSVVLTSPVVRPGMLTLVSMWLAESVYQFALSWLSEA